MLPQDILNYGIGPYLDINDLVNFNQTLEPSDRISRPLDIQKKIELCSAFNVIEIKRFLTNIPTSKEDKDLYILNFLKQPENFIYTCAVSKKFKQTLYDKIEEFKLHAQEDNHALSKDFQSLVIPSKMNWSPTLPWYVCPTLLEPYSDLLKFK